MRVPKFSTIFLLLIVLLSLVQDSTSRLETHVESERRSERKVSSMFIQSYSAILSSLNSRKISASSPVIIDKSSMSDVILYVLMDASS
ncbi:hypothetical protein CR513_50002, partial [Mucuna pruriens]